MIVLACALVAPAHAGSDYRWHDRFFFGLGVGGVSSELDSEDSRALVLGYDVSYWHNDYFGLRLATESSSVADDWGLDVFGAVPLRYVQLYGGPHLGLRNAESVDDGVTGQLHLVLGVQAYLGRNGRLFLQLQDPPVDALRVSAHHADVLMAGLRWSPDFVHRARPLNKLDMIYVPMMLTFAIWGLSSASQ